MNLSRGGGIGVIGGRQGNNVNTVFMHEILILKKYFFN